MKVSKTDWFEKEIKRLDKNPDSLTFKYILEFSENILEILDKKGIKNKNKYLAKKLKCSPAYISKLFNGRSNFTVKKLIELSEAVGYDLNISLRHRLVEISSTVFTTSINVKDQLENYSVFNPDESVSLIKDPEFVNDEFEPQAA